MKTKAIIIEDDEACIERLQRLLNSKHPDIEILTVCRTVLDAVAEINYHRPDLLFVDIQLDTERGGFEVLKHSKIEKYWVIFTTSHLEYQEDVKKLEFSGLDFLFKTVQENDLNEALDKYRNARSIPDSKPENAIRTLISNESQPDLLLKKIAIRDTKSGMSFILVSDILFCESQNNYTKFYLSNGQCLTSSKTLKRIDELLSGRPFFRVHHSYLVNLNEIVNYKDKGATGLITFSQKLGVPVSSVKNLDIPVSRAKKSEFKAALSAYKMLSK